VFDKLCRKTLEDHIDRYELSDEILALFQDDAVADPSDDENAGPVDIEAKDDDHGNENPRALATHRLPGWGEHLFHAHPIHLFGAFFGFLTG
jgi:hypothetical protein